ncbi:unnamed protein product [Lactuca virosa]|uniref:F-box domain-containing protein n=1 Tax=Lactuca virosa TaxID=75947 RepID=A0AAU9LP70_9ASTR|nr:unnamed protein product [Lactuca virosa]
MCHRQYLLRTNNTYYGILLEHTHGRTSRTYKSIISATLGNPICVKSDPLESEVFCGEKAFGLKRMNVEEDRLSSLPDDLIHKILSFLELEHAVRVSVLSSRWKFIWKSMPYLNLINFVKINSPPDFSKFVNNVLSHRNYQIHLSSVFLYSDGRVSHEFMKRFLEYVLTHNVQQLTVSWSPENEVEFPLSLYSSRSLQHLDLHNFANNASYLATPAWDLPALATLHLYNIRVSDNYTQVPQLEESQLKKLQRKHLISAPSLTSLVIKGHDPLQLIATQGQGFPSLEKVDLRLSFLRSEHAPKMVSLLQQLHTVKLLTLDLNILKILSSSAGLIMSNQPCPFANFKIVKFLKSDSGRVYLEVEANEKATTSLLDTSDQCSIFRMVSREEIKVMSDIVLATLLIARIRYRLKKRKSLTDTKQGPHMEQVDAPRKSCKRKMNDHGKVQVKKQKVQSAFEKQWHFGKMMTQIKKGKSEGLLTKLPTSDTGRLISLLQQIDRLVTELSASKRPVLQETFSIVCEEAAVVTNNMLDLFLANCSHLEDIRTRFMINYV